MGMYGLKQILLSERAHSMKEVLAKGLFAKKGLMIMGMVLAGCQVTVSSEESDDLSSPRQFVVESSGSQEVYADDLPYELIVTGDHNHITLEPDVKLITLTGHFNHIVIEQDAHIEVLSVTGSHNIVTDGNDVALVLEKIELSGSNNFISLGGYTELIDTGSDNQVLGSENDD